jgi:dolichol-phosphate mannosyltransferase
MSPMPADWSVPAFDTLLFAPKRSRHAIVIPVINEGERIGRQLHRMAELGLLNEYDTVLADGGSTDGSTDPKMLAALGLRARLVKTGPGRLSAQLRMAYAWAMSEGYEGVITIDGNGKDSVESIAAFAKALDRGVDYVQASRFRRGGQGINTPLARYLAIRLIHAPVLSLAAGVWLTDTTQGFRAYSRRYLLDDRVQPFREVFDRYELLAYLSVRASQLGYSVEELATTRAYPADEKVPTKIAGLHGYMELMLTLFRTVARYYHPKHKGRR